MGAKEAEQLFVEKVSEYLLSLPFDLKVLQEAVTDPDLAREVREIAAGTIIHTIQPQDGDSPGRYIDDVLIVRAAFARVVEGDSEGATAFRDRFVEIYDNLEADIRLFESVLGDLWPWVVSKLPTFTKLPHKGKKPSQYVDDEEAAAFLYEEGLEFQTNYPVKEEQVHNKVRRLDTILDLLNKKRADDAKKKA